MRQIRQYSQDDTHHSVLYLLTPAIFAALLVLAPSAPPLDGSACWPPNMANAEMMARAVARAQARTAWAGQARDAKGQGRADLADSPDAGPSCGKVGAVATACAVKAKPCRSA